MNETLSLWLLVVGFFNLLVATSVFIQTRSSAIRWPFLGLVAATAFWAWGIALFLVAMSVPYAQVYLNIYYVAAMAIASGVAIFGYRLSRQVRRSVDLAASLPTLLLAGWLMVVPDGLIRVVSVRGAMSGRVEIHGWPYLLYAMSFLTLFGLGWVWLTYGSRETASQRSKARRTIVSLGVMIAGLLGTLFNLFLPWFGNYEFIPVGPFFSVIFILCVTYASIRYSLFDLRRTFMISLGYILAGTVLAGIYLTLIAALGQVLIEGTTSRNVVTAMYVLFALFGVFTIEPMRKFFDRVTTKLFFRDNQSAEEVLGRFGNAILEESNIDSIVAKTQNAMTDALRVSFVVLIQPKASAGMGPESREAKIRAVLEDNHDALNGAVHDKNILNCESGLESSQLTRKLRHKGVSLLVHMKIKQQTIGYIVLGPKQSGTAYSASEILLVSAMADEAALAISNSERFDEIKKFNSRLEREIRQATAQLEASNAELRAVDATKDEFISMASHQLRTPLTSVKGYISMVLEGDAGKVTPMQKRLLEEAFTSSERMVHLIGAFLNVSRLQSGKFMLETHETNLAEVIRQEVDGMRQIARSHGVSLTYRQPKVFPTLIVDEGKLRQVVMNFIDNAIFYSPDSTPVTVSARVEDGMVVVRVVDEGIGVPKAAQAKLFSKFFRADNARLQRPDGTGIGLYLAKRIVDEHGGSIIFESHRGKGSTFGFRLPIKQLEQVD